MNISLSKPELVRLLRMALVGDWVMHAALMADELNDPEVVDHKRVLQKLLAAASKAKLDGLVRNEPPLKGHMTAEFEEEIVGIVDEWDEGRFWEMLADELARRDLRAEFGEDGVRDMDREERFVRLTRLTDSYEQEFMAHGLDRLRIVDGPEGGAA
ncbi:MAG: hypothetical protein R8K47_08790 [Mariprofundaceae bacterium]